MKLKFIAINIEMYVIYEKIRNRNRVIISDIINMF